MTRLIVCISILASLISAFSSADTISITPNVTVVRGAVNGVLIERCGKMLAVYGDPRKVSSFPEKVLFTHFRRDVVWAGRSFVERGAEAIVPARERESFLNANAYWQKQYTARFHDYDQQTTKVPVESFGHATGVRGGDVIEWQGLKIDVFDTPGYTRGTVSYLFETDGKRIACVGDLIYGDGKILDIYSLQDSIDTPKTGGYHGYMARTAQTIASLQTIAAASPDVLIPARGPIVDNPKKAIDTLISRLRAVYKNYLSISALRWYWKNEYIQGCAARILNTTGVDWMPMTDTMLPYPPEWIVSFGTSRLLVSKNGNGFLIDCGGLDAIKEVQKLQREKRVKNIEGIYITHYHDDHTNAMQEGSDAFGCPIYFCREQADILVNPGRYRMPCLTEKPARNYKIMNEGDTMCWNEFELTFSFFPGQTLYHGGLMVKKEGGETIFFIGDSFTPAGIDDYCTLNRNFLHPESGFFYCLDVLKHTPPDYYLINEHVNEPFRFSPTQLEMMADTLRERVELLADLFPWDNVNYGLDEQWARFYPYGVETAAGQSVQTHVVLFNHSNREQTYTVTVKAPCGWEIRQEIQTVTIPPREEGTFPVTVTPPADATGVSVLIADVSFSEWDLREWTEGLIQVTK